MFNDILELECVAYKDSDDIGDSTKGEAYWNRIYAKKNLLHKVSFTRHKHRDLN